MKRLLLLPILTFLLTLQAHPQGYAGRLSTIDIQHYRFALTLIDSTASIQGEATIKVRFQRPLQHLELDLTDIRPNGKGMKVTEVLENGGKRPFTHGNERLRIEVSPIPTLERTYTIRYQGIPADGLIITKAGTHGLTYFGDNWPNRAHNYLPCIDHPADKATVEFIVTAPVRYQVVSNGVQIEETNLDGGLKRTHYRSDEPLPTKVMVIGAGEFAVQYAGDSKGIPVSSWIFPDERDNGFKEYAQAVPILDFFSGMIAPYPYHKLANVQSRTRYGGMENAGCIFYHDKSAVGDGSSEALIAHEIAHQWYGNSASEADWHHVWLSEGFATYCTNLYFEQIRGRNIFIERMKADRQTVLSFPLSWTTPIIDTTITDYNRLLTPIVYEKGAWFLHMLRHQIGDDHFFNLLKTYYQRYKFSNALSSDFRQVAEELSGQDLKPFFQQWLYQPGHPKLDITYTYKKGPKTLQLSLKQTQTPLFTFPLDIAVVSESGKTHLQTLQVNAATHTYTLTLDGPPAQVLLDPNTQLLHEAKLNTGK